ncbi:MAG: TonB-dependent receptor [Prolixibacteraceae bacterium]|nr:TonB-dependent receptor [Prolixibacteraceae bacterium]
MKLTVFFLLAALIHVSASVYSQQTKLSISLKNTSVKEVLRTIEDQSEFFFLYKNENIDVNRTVNVDIKEKSVEALLDQVFKGTTVSYEVVNRQIVLIDKEKGNLFSEGQQQKSVSGKVTDSTGSPLPGVSVVVKGTTSGTITDFNGNYSLSNFHENATLQFSFVGMKVQELAVAGKTTINVKMVEDAIGIEEVVAVGYGTQKKGNLTGSVASVKSEKLTIAPIASAANTLVGRLPGLISKQTSGQPGSDAAELSIRGFGNALVIVDGIESSFNNIDANQIESVSILKDGAASIYGARAGNGVILVTTKRGQDQKPTITLNSSYTLQGVTAMLTPASSGQRTEMEREAWIQAGNPESTAPWTAEAVAKFHAGNDPLYPNTNWYKEVFRDWAPQQQHNLSVRGGSEKIKYYGFLGYTDQETMVKVNGGGYKRYNLQSNIDAKITKDLTLRLDLASAIEQKHFSIRGLGNGSHTWGDLFGSKPWYPAHIPDPTKIAWGGIDVGSIYYTTNMDLSGYSNNDSKNLRGTISLDYNIRAVKGLSVKAFANYLINDGLSKGFQKPGKFYTYDPTSGVYTHASSFLTKATLGQNYSTNSVFTQQYSVNYDNTFNENHHITAMALYESIDYKGEWFSASRIDYLTSAIDQLFAGSTVGMSNNGSANEMGRKSFIGRLNYNYKNKYLLESIFRADASAKFPDEKRWGYFPSVSLGWVLSQEEFMKRFGNLDMLKLRASYGQSGNDGVGNFQYLSGYAYGATYILGSGPQQGLISTGLANPNLTWEKVSISNLGLDFSLFKRKLYGEFDVFYRLRSGIPATRITTLPTTFGAGLPPENLNDISDRGFELNLGTAGQIGELSYDIAGNISWSRAKWEKYEEPEYTDPDQKRIYTNTGRWTDRVFGYKSDGLFTSQAEIDALDFEYLQGNSSLRPGDIRFVDTNGDRKLDWKDQVEIGKSTTPHWMFGFNTALKYKDFDLSALLQGAFGYYTNVSLGGWYSSAMYDLRWTKENNNSNALIPRLGGAGSNGYGSDYSFRKSSYLRLKTVSIGYNVPKRFLDKSGIQQLRVYAAGINLLTFSNLNKYGFDPEAPTDRPDVQFIKLYPQQRTISFGANISF